MKRPLWTAVLMVVLPFGACNEDAGDSDSNHDGVIRGCDDVDLSPLGEPVAFETVRCGDDLMLGRSGGYPWGARSGHVETAVVKTQAALDALLEFGELNPCSVDFARYVVLVAWFKYATEPMEPYPSLEFCGLRSTGDALRAFLFLNRGGGTENYGGGTVYHFVVIDATDLPISFDGVEYFPERDEN